MHAEAVARVVTLAAVVQSAVAVGLRALPNDAIDDDGGKAGRKTAAAAAAAAVDAVTGGGGRVGGGATEGDAMDADEDADADVDEEGEDGECDPLKRGYTAVLLALHPDAPGGGRGGAAADAVARGAAPTLWRIEAWPVVYSHETRFGST